MYSTVAMHRRPRSGTPVGVRLAIALAVPIAGAVTVAGIYLSKEIIVVAAWLALCLVGLVLSKPVIGVVVMTAGFLLAAYPTALQTLGVLTVANLLGVCLALMIVVHVLGTRDISFVKHRQVLVFAAIGVLLLLGTIYAEAAFPLLEHSRALGERGKILDRTSQLIQDFWTRLLFLIFFLAFVRGRRDVRVLFFTFVLVLFCAVPSALHNWMEGTLAKGFRATASITAGANANRMAMICLMQVACWYFWAQARPGSMRRLVAAAAIGASLVVVLATGSRSGLLGCAVLIALLQTGPRSLRVTPLHLGAGLLAGALALATVVPPLAWERMWTFSTEDPHAIGVSSVEKRETTIEVALKMVRDYPLLGIGLGNFREVSRQVYYDPYFRPPHNSYLWAAAQGGVIVFALYLYLLWLSWRDLHTIMQLSERDPTMAYMAAALRATFLLSCFFAFFADLFLSPIFYVQIGLIIALRRYLEGLPAEAPAVVLLPQRPPALARGRARLAHS
jgi:O-antigen ligase